MGDSFIPATGKTGAQLDHWNSQGQAIYGRVAE